MESRNKSSSTPHLHKLVRTLTKLLKFRTSKTRKIKFHEKAKDNPNSVSGVQQNQFFGEEIKENEKIMEKQAMGALVARVFASVSTIKASYAQLQIAQSPYDPEEIESADGLVVTELKHLSELKQSYLKNEDVDGSLQDVVLLAELKELKSVLKSYEIMGKKIDSQCKFRDSEITFLKEKLEECDKQNKLLEKQLDPFGCISVLDDLEFEELNAKHFVVFYRHGIGLIWSFVKLFVSQMSSAGWDLGAAAKSIEPGMVYEKPNEMFFAFESFVCREMFDGFQYPMFSTSNEQRGRQQWRRFFDMFMELKSTNAMEMLKLKPDCSFGRFCRVKYLGLVHPKMELSLFGDLNHRNVVDLGGYPETAFFIAFAQMAKHIWLLHCLAFSFDPEVNIFQVRKDCLFSEVFMESVVEEATDEDRQIVDPQVGFTVIPGFKIGKTVIQCQVYLSSG